MKKLVLTILIILALILTGITVVRGFQIKNLNILGIMQIKDKNEELDGKIDEATKLASTDYQKKMDDLNSEIKKLEAEKTKYEDMVNISTENQVDAANQFYDYLIDFLWIRVENHAKEEGVKMKLDLTRSSTGAEDTYNLNFTATGTYIGIAEFITHIEDDEKLGFKIEDFRMTAFSTPTTSTSSKNNTKENTNTVEDTNTVQAMFTCKDIKIEGVSSNMTSANMTKATDNGNSTQANGNTGNQ